MTRVFSRHYPRLCPRLCSAHRQRLPDGPEEFQGRGDAERAHGRYFRAVQVRRVLRAESGSRLCPLAFGCHCQVSAFATVRFPLFVLPAPVSVANPVLFDCVRLDVVFVFCRVSRPGQSAS